MNRILRHVRASVETMSPGYFSMVMATGILSLAAHLLAVPWLPGALFVLNWILFAIIGVLALARLYWYPRRVLEDLMDHLSAPGFRSEEHTSELQSLMRISYAVFCLKKKKKNITKTTHTALLRLNKLNS